MNISRDFIGSVVEAFHTALSSRNNLCQVARSELTVDFYKKHAYQELYALRYIPAYYFEYCVLVEELKKRLGNNIPKLYVTSFGCGLSPDYYAFRDNLPEDSFEYTGFDSVQWSSQKHMPPVGNNHKFIFENIRNLHFENIANTDIFVFPKSIGDIKSGGDNILEHLGKLISASKKHKIYFLNSYVTRDRNSPVDLTAFKIIHQALLSAGFQTNDDIEKTYYQHDGNTTDKAIGLRAINIDFLYPNKRIVCDEMDKSNNDCRQCPVPMSPIYTNSYMAYQIVEYLKQ